jgi:lysozyme family protein
MDQIDRLIKREGGSKVVKLIGDSGGVTKYGISSTYNPDVDVVNLTYEQAREIYENKYLKAYNIHLLPQPIQETMFDYTVHSGANNSFKTLCATLSLPFRLKVDEEILDKIKQFDVFKLNVAICKNRLNFLTSLKKFAGSTDFGRGWTRRVLELL